MTYVDKVIYNGTIVDVEDIVCPGTELAHYSLGNLKKNINNVVKNMNEFAVKLDTMEDLINKELVELKAVVDKNAKQYETTITTRLNSEKSKYDLLYQHANQILADSTNSLNELSTNYSHMDESITELTTIANDYGAVLAKNSYINAIEADQIINIKTQLNKIIEYLGKIISAIETGNSDELTTFKTNNQLTKHHEDELKYDSIANLDQEWKQYATQYNPLNKLGDL